MGKKEQLYVEEIEISTKDEDLWYRFHFVVEDPVDADNALELGTSAVKGFRDLLESKTDYRVLQDMYNIAERGFIKLGTIPDFVRIDHPSNREHKVMPYDKLQDSEILVHEGEIPYLTVYAIDGTPSKGYVFCRSTLHSKKASTFDYMGEHIFTFTDAFNKFQGELIITIASPGYMVALNQDTQIERMGDYFATPENMFNIATFKDDEGELNGEYSIIPGRRERNKPTIRTTDYNTLYDGDRFDMEIYIPLAFGQRGELRIEPHKLFADKVNEALKKDKKYRLNGGSDWISLKYVPYEYLDQIFEIAKEVIRLTDKQLSDPKKK